MANVRTIICGSPQPQGKCHSVAGRLADALRLRFPHDDVRFFCVAQGGIAPCQGCNACAATGECIQHDAMYEILDALSSSSHLFVVSPVYFAGPPAQLKALLDRFQPLYFQRKLEQGSVPRSDLEQVEEPSISRSNQSTSGSGTGVGSAFQPEETEQESASSSSQSEHGKALLISNTSEAPHRAKKPAYLVAVGAGGDPYGWAPLETICRSALAVAGWGLQQTLPLIGMETDEACDSAESWLNELMEGERL